MNAFSHAELSAISMEELVSPQGLSPVEMLDVLMGQNFGVEYQSIVSVQAGDVAGYQAAARACSH